MRFGRLGVLSFLAAGFICAFAGEGMACNLKSGDALIPQAIIDGQSLVLADGHEAVLAGIEVPRLVEGRGQYAREAQGRLTELLRDGVRIAYDKVREDRYGRLLVFPLLADGQTAQAHLVAEGLARVMSSPDSRACAGELLALEAKARTGRRGLWSDPYFAVVDAGDVAGLHRAEGRFVIVEGVVADAASIRGRFYVNFGEDHHRDFTVTVAPAAAKLFRTGIWASILGQPTVLVGRIIRVRGFVESFNGPEIAVTHPEQIEFPEHGREAASSSGKKHRSSD